MNGRNSAKREDVEVPNTATPYSFPLAVLVNAKTGLKAQQGESDTVLEVFKPSEEPDDAHSNMGFFSEPGSGPPGRNEERSLVTREGLR